MSYARKSSGTVAISIGGVMLLAALAVWQFYRFVMFKNTAGITDIQGGSLHLWLAIAAALAACVAGFFVFSVFLRYDGDDEIHITSTPAQDRRLAAKTK